MSKTIKRYEITGTDHGALVYAKTEGNARRAFHKKYNGETIISISCQGKWLQRPFYDIN